MRCIVLSQAMGIGRSAPNPSTAGRGETSGRVWSSPLPLPVGSSNGTVQSTKQLRQTIARLLTDGGLLPVLPLIEIVASYALPIPLTVSTIAGEERGFADGFGSEAMFRTPAACLLYRPTKSSPSDAKRDDDGWEDEILLVCDLYGQRIRCVNLITHEVKVWSRASAFYEYPTSTRLVPYAWRHPNGICLNRADNSLFILETFPTRVQRFSPHERTITFLAGQPAPNDEESRMFRDGTGDHARFNEPNGLACTSDGGLCIVADTDNHRIRQINVANCVVSTVAGGGAAINADAAFGPFGSVEAPSAVVFGGSDAVLYVVASGAIRRLDMKTGRLSTLAVNAKLYWKPRTALWLPPNKLIVGTNESLYSLNVETGELLWFAGGGCPGTVDGPALRAKFNQPDGLALTEKRSAPAPSGDDSSSEMVDGLYVVDMKNNRIRLVSGTIYGVL